MTRTEELRCPIPWQTARCWGHLQPATETVAADYTGTVERRRDEWAGTILLDAWTPMHEGPAGIWLHPRGTLPGACYCQRRHGRRRHRKNGGG
ncbi:hypothetical protein OH799_01215 [Nocardia sp. NBC_00881]|uniref:hypothetical protein n=1 Tax=Nocardia sp. NBC_00881 TaxID=2975995 RepID=UPI00386ADBAE|nr:hypothetical protein OH799_01215 [Nocardia sp. NBC_00881]